MPDCWIALGGNVGDVEETFRTALDCLNAEPGIRVGPTSSIHRTAPVGGVAGGPFLNACAELETDRPPLELLDVLQSVEARLGRVRTQHWGPRTLDLDLLLYGDELIDTPRLSVPHPQMWFRRFVLDPLAEIAADVVHPIKQVTIGELRSRLLVRPFRCALAGRNTEIRQDLMEQVQPEFPEVNFSHWSAESGIPELLVWLGSDAHAPEADSAALPPLPRLDVQAVAGPRESLKQTLRNVLTAALGSTLGNASGRV